MTEGFSFILHELVKLPFSSAYLLAIESAVLTNFFLHERWTFKDCRQEHTLRSRLLKFHAVSSLGMALNYVITMFTMVALLRLLDSSHALQLYFAGPQHAIFRYLVRPLLHPPVLVFPWAYIASLCGIGVATFWNFFANLLWTWRPAKG